MQDLFLQTQAALKGGDSLPTGSLIETVNGGGGAVTLRTTGPLTERPISGLLMYPVEVVKAEGAYYCTGWYLP